MTPTRCSPSTPDLDAALCHVAGCLIANTEVSIDEQGRPHAGKIDAVPDRRV